MQARVQGLIPSPLRSPERSAHPVKQEQMLGDCNKPTEGHITASHPGTYGVMAKTAGGKLDDMLMEDMVLPLTTSLSPKSSSTKSSVSMEDYKRTC